jgi:hypothetical protein
MSDRADRRTNTRLRRRIDHLLGQVQEAREEIVERGLTAVETSKPGTAEAAPAPDGDPGPVDVPASVVR